LIEVRSSVSKLRLAAERVKVKTKVRDIEGAFSVA